MELSFWNCFYFLLPVLIWNLIFAPKLKQDIFNIKIKNLKLLEVFENIFRYSTFIFPLFLPISITSQNQESGILIYLVGLIIYFMSWLPLILFSDFDFSNKKIFIFAPHITPIIFFIGISLIGNSILLAIISSIFVSIHTFKAIVKLRIISQETN